MQAEIKISGLAQVETDARELLAHIEAIRDIQMRLCIPPIRVETDLKEEAASGN